MFQKAEIDGQAFVLRTDADFAAAPPQREEILVEVLSGLAQGDVVVGDAPDTAREGDRLVRG